VAVLIFVFVWNDFLIGATLTTQEEMRTVQVGLVRFLQDTLGVWWGQFMAFTMLASAPILLTFFILQKRFIAGLTAGATKG
jgi:multiple sugar transport system permease protein